MIKYIVGSAVEPVNTGKTNVIMHCCNDIGVWGAGFVLAISEKWPEPEQAYRLWAESKWNFELGRCQLVQVEDSTYVANLIGQRGVGFKNGPPIRYEFLKLAMKEIRGKIASRFRLNLLSDSNFAIHAPRLGCGLAGGNWTCIEEIINEVFSDVDVYIYDLEPWYGVNYVF